MSTPHRADQHTSNDEAAFSPRARLTVLIDFKSSHALLAKDALHALEQELGIDGDWLPLQITHPLRRPTEAAANDRGARHRRFRAAYYEEDLRRYARLRGLKVPDVYPDIDSTAPALGLLWLRNAPADLRRQYVSRMFDSHYATPLTAADVRRVLNDIGSDGEAFLHFAAREGMAELTALQVAFRASGFTTSPTYLLDGEYFQGRQHLPMLRWLLTEKHLEPPM